MASLGQIVEVPQAEPTTLKSVFQSEDVLGFITWNAPYHAYVCIAVPDPDLEESISGPMCLLKFYSSYGLSTFRLRYVYHCDLPFIGLTTVPGEHGDDLLLMTEPSHRTVFTIFGVDDDARVHPIWEDINYQHPQFIDFDDDGVREILVRYPDVDFFEREPRQALVYRKLDGVYRLVARLPWGDRFCMKQLPGVPLPDEP